jgi:hypothetical protein
MKTSIKISDLRNETDTSDLQFKKQDLHTDIQVWHRSKIAEE